MAVDSVHYVLFPDGIFADSHNVIGHVVHEEEGGVEFRVYIVIGTRECIHAQFIDTIRQVGQRLVSAERAAHATYYVHDFCHAAMGHLGFSFVGPASEAADEVGIIQDECHVGAGLGIGQLDAQDHLLQVGHFGGELFLGQGMGGQDVGAVAVGIVARCDFISFVEIVFEEVSIVVLLFHLGQLGTCVLHGSDIGLVCLGRLGNGVMHGLCLSIFLDEFLE